MASGPDFGSFRVSRGQSYSAVADSHREDANAELFLLVALSIGIGTAAVTQLAGLSLALGAFLAGLIISGSEMVINASRFFHYATRSWRFSCDNRYPDRSARGIGEHTTAQPHARTDYRGGKFIISTLVVRLFRYTWGTALLVGVGLTQIEAAGVRASRRTAGQVSEMYNATLAASLLSILLNAPLVRYAPGWIATLHFKMGRAFLPIQGGVPDDQAGHVVLCGFGRMGSTVGLALDHFELPYTVIERDPRRSSVTSTRNFLRLRGRIPNGVLKAAGAQHAALVIVALPIDPRGRPYPSTTPRAQREHPSSCRAHGSRD